MKKRYIFLFLFSACLSVASAQITLTSHDYRLSPGDSSHTREINFIDPGNAGENQVWDFSGIKFTGKSTLRGVEENPASKANTSRKQILILSEEGFDYTYLTDEEGAGETGYVNSGKKMVMEYSDPIVKMKYPFTFGDSYSDDFSGVAWHHKTSRTDVSGTYTVSADAYGTLILPDRILKNTLRVKTVKQSLQQGVCGSTQSNVEKYYWYAPGYRYPVVTISQTSNRYANKEPVVSKTGWVNLDQPNSAGSGQGTTGSLVSSEVLVYPNPFTDRLNYSYFLGKQAIVSVDLYDLTGKISQKIEKSFLQTEGLHSGILSPGLPSGIYYLRFTMDKEVVVTKIVKL